MKRCNTKDPGVNTNKCSDQKGFTLVEVVVGSALLILTFAALILSLTQMKQSAFAVQHRSEAMHVARSEVESLRANSYSNIVGYTNIALTNTVLSDLGGTRDCTVITSNDYKQITLTINWFDPGKSNSSSLSIDTLICDTNF